MNANKTLLRKKVLEIDVLEILIDYAIGRVILDRVYLIVKNIITTIQDAYQWRKKADVCSFLDDCEETGENISGRMVLGVDSIGRNTCGGCLERFACHEKKAELRERIKLEAKITWDDISDENADLLAEQIIRNRERFYLIKKIEAPILLVKKILKNLKWKWGELRNKQAIMGCKSCGAMWTSNLYSSYETCPNCESTNYTYPIQHGKMDFRIKGLIEACRKTELKPGKLDNSLSRTWSKSVENDSGSWGISIIAQLNPNQKGMQFVCGSISLNMDVITSRFFVSLDDVNNFICNFEKHYA